MATVNVRTQEAIEVLAVCLYQGVIVSVLTRSVLRVTLSVTTRYVAPIATAA